MNSPIANSRESPGRIGKSSPHSTKTITTDAQNICCAELVEPPLGVHPVQPEQQRCQEVHVGTLTGAP